MKSMNKQMSGFIGIFLIQITIIILYGIFVRYDIEMLPTSKKDNVTEEQRLDIERKHNVSYPRKY